MAVYKLRCMSGRGTVKRLAVKRKHRKEEGNRTVKRANKFTQEVPK